MARKAAGGQEAEVVEETKAKRQKCMELLGKLELLGKMMKLLDWIGQMERLHALAQQASTPASGLDSI